MTLRIEVADLGLPALDALEADALAVFVGPERPLQGLAGYADWRLCGALSRAIRQGHFATETGEALLLPSDGRLFPPRVFCFGVPDATLSPGDFASLARRACDAMARAQTRFFATALPSLRSEALGAGPRLWLEASLAHPAVKQVILGEARALQRELAAARQALSADVEIVAPPVRVEMPRRPAYVLPRSAVTR
jgi:hypothetical protein